MITPASGLSSGSGSAVLQRAFTRLGCSRMLCRAPALIAALAVLVETDESSAGANR